MTRRSVRRWSWVVPAIWALTAALVLPAASTGAPKAGAASLFTTGFVYKGYSWSLIASNQGGKASLLITATKRAGTATQTHTYSFASGVSFTVNAALTSAKLTARLGRYGTINATFRGAGDLASRSLPKPCTGPKFQSRSGPLSGFRFVADTTFFKTVVKSPVPAMLSRMTNTAKINCGGGPTGGKPPAGGASLTAFATGAGTTTVSASKTAAGAVTQTVTVSEDPAQTAPGTVFHSITTPAPSGSFTFAADLSSANVTGTGAFLRGTLAFASTQAAGNNAFGAVTGNYTAKFDSIGPKTPASAGIQATLIKS